MSSADLFLAAHDAGGAEILSSWARGLPRGSLRFCLEGPAVAVFARKLGEVANVHRAGVAAEWEARRPDLVVTGTSWASDLEMGIRDAARFQGIRTAAYLEHWANYRERFGYPGPWLERLPDEVWCPDRESLALCKNLGFPASRLALMGNPYLDEMVRGIRDLGPREEEGTVLYVCEPIRAHMEKAHGNPLHLGYDEFDAMRHFFAASARWDGPPRRVLVRKHPSEPEGRYDAFLEPFRTGMDIEATRGTTLLEDIARASTVVGCESMAMVVALAAGKRVRTSIPPQGQPGRLPFRDILPV